MKKWQVFKNADGAATIVSSQTGVPIEYSEALVACLERLDAEDWTIVSVIFKPPLSYLSGGTYEIVAWREEK